MNRIYTIIIVLIAALTARAADTLSICHQAPQACELRYHLRVEPNGDSPLSVTLTWSSDSVTRSAVIATEGIDADDEITGKLFDIVYFEDSVLKISKKLRNTAKSREKGLSMILSYENNTATLEAGTEKVDILIPVGFDSSDSVTISAQISGASKILRDDFSYTPSTSPVVFDIDQITAEIESSDDPIVGFWVYFDRDNKPLKSRLGGEYTLAIIPDGDGGYHIIYIDGAKENAGNWPAGRLKGHLTPTPIQSTFDLMWADAYSRQIDRDTSASFEQLGDGHVITLQFPLYSAIFRFVKREKDGTRI